jgi:glutaredoxin-related protein
MLMRFTKETMQFFDKYGYPYELIDVLSQPTKREALAKMTNWPTLPKVFIDGQFYGDTDILDPMAAKGEIEPLLKKHSGNRAVKKTGKGVSKLSCFCNARPRPRWTRAESWKQTPFLLGRAAAREGRGGGRLSSSCARTPSRQKVIGACAQ